MRAIWNGFISFGLVTIPVSVGLAQQRSDVSFRTLSRETLQPVKQKRWDPERDVEVGSEATVKGWEASKGRYLPVEDDELERFAARQEKTIQILAFVEMSEVDPVYYERAYWLEPQERAERPYALLQQAMERTGRAALGRFVLSTKEHLVLLRPTGGTLALETLYYPEDVRIRDQREIAERLQGVEVSDQELAMAEQLVEGLARPFQPEEYPNETRASLLEFLEAKAAGEEIAASEEVREPAPVVDLAEVDPVYYERAYWLEPQERAERPYALLRTAMEESGRAALGRFVLSTKEHLVLLRPTGGILALETLYYPEDVRIRDQREIAERLEGVEVSKEELTMAEQLVEGLARSFQPEEYPNETRAALVQFLEAKAAGEEIAAPEEAREPAPVVDLMAALKASLAAAGGDGGDAEGEAADTKADDDDQLSIEQSRLRGVQGGGEGGGGKSRKSSAKSPAKKSGTQRRRKAS